MTRKLRAVWPLSFVAFAAAAWCGEDPRTAVSGDARCAVWASELGFARAVAEHDAAAFAGFVHDDAVFGVGGRKTTRGRAAIVAEWAAVIDGSAVELRWYPDAVSVGAGGGIAYSSGPALYRDPKDGSYWRSRFNSVWLRGGDGRWQVVFDGGSEPVRTDEAGAKAFEDGRRGECPAT